jgi:hypothetical protein
MDASLHPVAADLPQSPRVALLRAGGLSTVSRGSLSLDVYSQARKGAKRQAQQRVVEMILPERFEDAAPAICLEGARVRE